MTQAVTTKRSLLDIGDDMQAIDDLLYEAGGDISDLKVRHPLQRKVIEIAKNSHCSCDLTGCDCENASNSRSASRRPADSATSSA